MASTKQVCLYCQWLFYAGANGGGVQSQAHSFVTDPNSKPIFQMRYM